MFYPGDKIKCISDANSFPTLHAGTVYTVSNINGNRSCVQLVEKGIFAYELDRFELFRPATLVHSPLQLADPIIYAPATTVPTVIENEQLVFVDVDETMIIWGTEPHVSAGETVSIRCPYSTTMTIEKVRPHLGHIKILKDRKARGAHITVWSAGGYKWALAVVQALGLEQYVDVISSKPFMYIDDKEAKDIMGERLYLGLDSTYGTK